MIIKSRGKTKVKRLAFAGNFSFVTKVSVKPRGYYAGVVVIVTVQ